MAVYVTGDIHGSLQIHRLSHKAWPEGRELCRDDFVIILGDFGLLFYNNPTPDERYWLKWLNNKPWTTLFVDGNHENHTMLNELPAISFMGGTAGKVSKNIYHLKRGEIYTLCEKKFFTFGGAVSIDKHLRIEGASWWREEVATYAEMDYGLGNLEKHQYNVDYILAHTAPMEIIQLYCLRCLNNMKIDIPDPTTGYLDQVCKTTSFEGFYCGQWHDDWS